jgi:hypothetical protein
VDLADLDDHVYERLGELSQDRYFTAMYLIALDLRELYSAFLTDQIDALIQRTLRYASGPGQDSVPEGEALLDSWESVVRESDGPYGLLHLNRTFHCLVAELHNAATPPEQHYKSVRAREFVTGALVEPPVTAGNRGLVRVDKLPEAPPDSLAHRLLQRTSSIIDLVTQEDSLAAPELEHRRSQVLGSLEPIPHQA